MHFCIERLDYRNFNEKYAYIVQCGSDNSIIWNDLKTLQGYLKRLEKWLTIGYYNLTINNNEYLLVIHNGNGYLNNIPYFDLKKEKIIQRSVDFNHLVKE